MKVDLSAELKDFNGEFIPFDEKRNMTVADVFMTALSSPLEGDDKDSGEVRMQKYELGTNCFKNKTGSLAFKSEDIALIKERVRKTYPSPVIYGEICKALNEKA